MRFVASRRRAGYVRGVLAWLCLGLAIALVPVTVVTRWAGSSLLSTSGFTDAMADLPRSRPVQAEFAVQLGRPLATAAAKLPEPIPTLVRESTDAAVAALMNSDLFAALWRTSLRTAHEQLLQILRHDSRSVVLAGSDLQVDVPVTTELLLGVAGLPRSLSRFMPIAVPVRITVLSSTALSRASTAVRITDTLGNALPLSLLILAALGIAAARRRQRAAICAASAGAATTGLVAVAVVPLTDTVSAVAVAAAVATKLTGPLIHQLAYTTAAGAAAAVTLGVAAGVQARRTSLGSP